MKAIRLSAGCLVLTMSQLAAAAGPYIHEPIQTRPCCAGKGTGLLTSTSPSERMKALTASSAQLNAALAPSLKISPSFVTTYEPSTNVWVRTPRLRLSEEARSSEAKRLWQILKNSGSVEVPATLADPAWMQQYRDRAILLEDPVPLK
uniref:Uncharacterized protein n=1 Tax=uncultured bacterium EC5 TaxID=672206 RepID=G4WV75_9BACT|nr:hypothetical protein [uncultured bacterium EC5]